MPSPLRFARWAGLLLTLALAAGAAETAPLRTLYLVRHGIYDPVPGADSKVANGLNALGREQAGFAAARLAGLPVKFDAIISSEFTRARETGDVIAARLGLPCQRDALLNEALPPGVDLAALKLAGNPADAAQLNAAWDHFARPAGDQARNEILVCHGNVIRWFVCRALGVDPGQWTRMGTTNCALTVIVIKPDGSSRLMFYNDASHVPPDKQTWEASNPPAWLPAKQK